MGTSERWCGADPHTGFGYHIDVQRDTRYLDLWLYAYTPDVFCTGRHGGCKRWFAKYMSGNLPHYDVNDYFPLVFRPFGPYLMPAPHGSRILTAQYHSTWNSTCLGWQVGTTPCAQFYDVARGSKRPSQSSPMTSVSAS